MSRAVCPKCGCTDVSWIRDDTDCAQYICLECKQAFCYPPKTVFDKITASPEVLAEKLVYRQISTVFIGEWRSVILPAHIYGCFRTKEEAVAATIEKLKEVEKCESI